MRTVLIIGAGRSASSLIQYLLNKSVEEDLHLIIGDLSLESAQNKTNNHPNATAILLDIFDQNQRKAAIQKAATQPQPTTHKSEKPNKQTTKRTCTSRKKERRKNEQQQ